MMRALAFLLMLLCAITACNQRDVLHEYNWLLVKAYYNGKPLPVSPTDALTFAGPGGYQFFTFPKGDDDIILPGLGTPTARASWNIENGKIHFVLDSGRYGSFKSETADLMTQTFEIDDDITETMEFYREPFEFEVTYDTLYLKSQTTTLIALMDKRF